MRTMSKNRKNKVSVELADGGSVSIEQDGRGFRMVVTHGYKETPEERKERLQHAKRGGFHEDKRREKRSKVKQNLRKEW